jgi:hypothetical protein
MPKNKLSASLISSPSRNHIVYDRALEVLADRRLICPINGLELSPLLPQVKRLLLSNGDTLLQIAQAESSILDVASIHPKWIVDQAAPSALYMEWRRYGREEQIIDNRISPVPDHRQNIEACLSLLELFTASELLSVPGFVRKQTVIDHVGQQVVMIDLSSAWAYEGFVMPVRRDGQISALKVFRDPHDTKPFLLKSKGDRIYG